MVSISFASTLAASFDDFLFGAIGVADCPWANKFIAVMLPYWTFNDRAIRLHKSTLSAQLAPWKASFNHLAVWVHNPAITVHTIVLEKSFTNTSVRAYNLSIPMKIVIFKMTKCCQARKQVPSIPMNAMKAIGSTFKFTFIKKTLILLLLLLLVIND